MKNKIVIRNGDFIHPVDIGKFSCTCTSYCWLDDTTFCYSHTNGIKMLHVETGQSSTFLKDAKSLLKYKLEPDSHGDLFIEALRGIKIILPRQKCASAAVSKPQSLL